MARRGCAFNYLPPAFPDRYLAKMSTNGYHPSHFSNHSTSSNNRMRGSRNPNVTHHGGAATRFIPNPPPSLTPEQVRKIQSQQNFQFQAQWAELPIVTQNTTLSTQWTPKQLGSVPYTGLNRDDLAYIVGQIKITEIEKHLVDKLLDTLSIIKTPELTFRLRATIKQQTLDLQQSLIASDDMDGARSLEIIHSIFEVPQSQLRQLTPSHFAPLVCSLLYHPG